MKFDGERYLPEVGGVIHAEHMHRYRLAKALASGKDVLDVACGEGYGSDLLAMMAQSVVGVDGSLETIESAQKTYHRKNLRFIQGDCADLPCNTASFDMVVSFETIEHHDRHEEMLHEIRRVLRPGGSLMISSPNRPVFNLAASEPNPFHVKELDLEEFATLLRLHFKNVAIYAQRVMSGSCIAPLQALVGDFRHFDDKGGGTSKIPRPVYFLALASDEQLPTFGASVYEVPQAILHPQERGVLEARLYISEIVDGVPLRYSESRGASVLYPMSSQRQTVCLPMPPDLKPLAQIRLDPANRPVALYMHRLALLLADGTEAWRWDGHLGLLKGIGGLAFRHAADGVLFLSLNDDPQFELTLPAEVLAKMQANASLVAELTPRPLLQVIAEVLRQDAQKIAELSSDSVGEVSAGASAAHSDSPLPKLRLSHDLAALATLLTTSLASRDKVLIEQSRQIGAMRHELLRAEAQLALMKELMLGEVYTRDLFGGDA